MAKITANYHVLEKGLSFRDSHPLFGKGIVAALIEELSEYAKLGVFNGNLL